MADPVVMKYRGKVMICATQCPVHDEVCNEYRFELNDKGIITDFWWLHTIDNCGEAVHVSQADIDNYVSKVSYHDILVGPGPPNATREWYLQNMKRFPIKDGKSVHEK